jgi:hypothetical protein
MRWLVGILAVVLVGACGDDGAAIDAGNGNGDGGATTDSGPTIDAGPRPDAENCQPPDMLIVLDRTMSMHRRPDGSVPADTMAGHMESKWYLAITALEEVTSNLDATIRFGLEMFPLDPGMDQCVTLSQRIQGTTASNTGCQEGAVDVSPDLNTATAIDNAMDPETTRLCTSTPIGAGLGTAISELSLIADPIRDQYAILLTDGQDTCDEDLSLYNAQMLGAAGVGLYVIGFDGSGNGVDHGHLNDLACAGRTAPDPATNCMTDGMGGFIATDRSGPTLYLLADTASVLTEQLEDVAGDVCCNCIP